MFRHMFASLLAAAALAACSDAPTQVATPSAPPSLATMGIVGIKIMPRSVTLAPGGSQTLSSLVSYSTGATGDIGPSGLSWSSTAPTVATVSATGVVTGVAAGTAKVVANRWGIYTDTAVVTVSGGTATAAVTAVASVAVSAPCSKIVPNRTIAATATVKDAAGNALTGRTVVWTTSAPGVASVSASGAIRGVSYGTAVISATVDGKSGSVTCVVAPGYFEPVGMRLITDRAFNALGTEGWDGGVEIRYPAAQKIVTDASAPRSPGSVIQQLFPQGFAGGSSPAIAQMIIPSTATYTRLYMSFWMKLSSNWQGNITGTNKIFHLWVAGGNRVFLSANGAGTGPLTYYLRMQGVPDVRRHLAPNLVLEDQARIVRGQWQHLEVYVKVNTAGNPDGVIEWWLDGRPIGRYTDLAILSSTDAHRWEQVQWSPTWGGNGDVVQVPGGMTMSLDHVYVSGGN